MTSWSGSVAVMTIRPRGGERLEEEPARGGRDPEDLFARHQTLEQPAELPLVQVRTGDVQMGMPAVVVAVPQDDDPERILRPEPLAQLIDVGGDPLAGRESPRARQRGAVARLARDAESHQDLAGGEAATLHQRLVQLLDRRREQLAVLVVARQAANDQGTPGPCGRRSPFRPRARLVRAGRSAAQAEVKARDPRRDATRRQPARSVHRNPVTSLHESVSTGAIGAGFGWPVTSRHPWSRRLPDCARRSHDAHIGYEASRVTTSIATMRQLSTKFFGSLSGPCQSIPRSARTTTASRWRTARAGPDEEGPQAHVGPVPEAAEIQGRPIDHGSLRSC